ncbi:hypothetical protein ASF22_22665 [Methylobacterium sp. Leaf87]|nr:hypothetical protein ASF22_22665 [Methylobacterium sp. Leaf87]
MSCRIVTGIVALTGGIQRIGRWKIRTPLACTAIVAMKQRLTRDNVGKIALCRERVLLRAARIEFVGRSAGLAGRSSQDLGYTGARIGLGQCFSGAGVRV